MRRVSLWGPVGLYMAGIFAASSLSSPPIPAGTDTPLHALAYLGLALVVIRAVAGGLPARVTVRIATVALMITVGYGMSDEAHQLFVPGREADVFDLLADAGGAAAGTVACWAWGIISPVSRDER